MIKITDNIIKLEKEQYEGANVFFQSEYATFIQSTGKQIIYCYSNKFVIPIVITRKIFFKYGQLMSEPYCFNPLNNEEMVHFLNQVSSYLKTELKLQWLLPTPASAFFDCIPDNATKIPFGSHVINLELSIEDLNKRVHTKHRNSIKKAQKDGIIIKSGNNPDLVADFSAINSETWERSGIKSDGLDYWEMMIKAMPNNAIIYIAYEGNTPQSGAIFYFNSSMCYYMYGANKNNPHTGSGNLLQWQAIQDMKERGVKRYSFVGCRINEDESSKYHGIQRFKERFGGDLVQGYMFKIVYNVVARSAFNFLFGIHSLLYTGKYHPIRDIIDQEISKWE